MSNETKHTPTTRINDYDAHRPFDKRNAYENELRDVATHLQMQRDALAAALRDARNELADLNQQEVDEGALIERLDALLSKL